MSQLWRLLDNQIAHYVALLDGICPSTDLLNSTDLATDTVRQAAVAQNPRKGIISKTTKTVSDMMKLLIASSAGSKKSIATLKASVARGKAAVATDYVLGKLAECTEAARVLALPVAQRPSGVELKEPCTIAAEALSSLATKKLAVAECLKSALVALTKVKP